MNMKLTKATQNGEEIFMFWVENDLSAPKLVLTRKELADIARQFEELNGKPTETIGVSGTLAFKNGRLTEVKGFGTQNNSIESLIKIPKKYEKQEKGSQRAWTIGEMQTVMDYSKSLQSIADELGRTYDSVAAKRKTLVASGFDKEVIRIPDKQVMGIAGWLKRHGKNIKESNEKKY